MAKGNMFQGMARGVVGDVVFSRLNGEQISRVRNRRPANPRTNAQLYQRAVMATVMQAYSAGKVIFDHSFQGKRVGAENQQRFMAENAKILRNLIIADLSTTTPVAIEDQKGRVVAPGISSPVPFVGMKISEGGYTNNLLNEQVGDDGPFIKLPAPLADETCAAYAQRNGIISGDYYTIVILGVDDSNILYNGAQFATSQQFFAQQFAGVFSFIRLGVRDSFLADTTAVASKKLSDVFVVDAADSLINASNLTNSNVGDTVFPYTLVRIDGEPISNSLYGVIRSRKDQDLRSTSYLHYAHIDGFVAGIAPGYLLDVWGGDTSTLGNSDLILEGGGF